jgi:hypothetical protein
MKNSFLWVLIETLIAINLIAWSFPLLDQFVIARLLKTQGKVLEATIVENDEIVGNTTIRVKRLKIKVEYEFQSEKFQKELIVIRINGIESALKNIQNYYSMNKSIDVWVDPENRNEIRLSDKTTMLTLGCTITSIDQFMCYRKNRFLSLPEIFLIILISVFCISKLVERYKLKPDAAIP